MPVRWGIPGGGNCKKTSFSHQNCVRARCRQQDLAHGASLQVFLGCFCLLDLCQACLSLIIKQALFSAWCVFYLGHKGLVNRSGGVRKQVNRGGVLQRPCRGIFLVITASAEWTICEACWQRSGPSRQMAGRAKTFDSGPPACYWTLEISKQASSLQVKHKAKP